MHKNTPKINGNTTNPIIHPPNSFLNFSGYFPILASAYCYKHTQANTALTTRAHSFPRKNLTNSAANLENSAAHRGKTDEIPRLTADTQLNHESTGQIHVMNL